MTQFDFMGKRKNAAILSLALVGIALLSLTFKSLEFGLDFTGGTLVELRYDRAIDAQEVRETLEEQGFIDPVAQAFGSDRDILVRIPPQEGKDNAKLGDQVIDALGNTGEKVDLRRSEFVGPAVGEELREQGGLGLLFALLSVMVYVAFRFQYKFAIGAVVALAHDVFITLGIFSVFNLNFDLTVLAALLAVIGYSLNDTIVVSDRIRENFRKLRKGSSVDIINTSLNQTFGRTVITSLTTLFVLLALFFIGGELISGFSLALIIGVIVGTYSSIYVAANILIWMDISKEDLIIPEREVEGADELP